MVLPAEFPSLESFAVGDLVWAKSGRKSEPFWPAVVSDPCVAPEAVQRFLAADQLLVMFFGPAMGKSRDRDFAFVKRVRARGRWTHNPPRPATLMMTGRPAGR